MHEIQYRPAWKQHDPVIERDAEILWRREKALRPTADVEANLAALCAVGYVGDELVATAMATVDPVPLLRCRLAMYRCFVAAGARRRGIATGLTLFSRNLIEAWSREHPNEELLGVGAIIRSRVLAQNLDLPVYPKTKFVLIGYTERGFQMRIYWFEHARISKYWPGFQLDDAGSEDINEL